MMTTKDLLKKTSIAPLAVASLVVTPLFSQHTEAAGVVIMASDNGSDLTLTFSGSIDRSGDSTNGVAHYFQWDNFNELSTSVFSISEASPYYANNIGTWAGNDPWIAGSVYNSPATSLGSLDFGFQANALLWDNSLGEDPDTVTTDKVVTFTGYTVASAFGTNLDSGPVLLWTHTNSGDTITIASATVPEPSSATLLGFGAFACIIRRKR